MTQLHTLYNGRYVISFDPTKKYRYSMVVEDGKKLEKPRPIKLSVTGVTSCFDKSPQLLAWAEKLTNQHVVTLSEQDWLDFNDYEGHQTWEAAVKIVEECASQYRLKKEEAAGIGDIVHNFAEQYAKWEIAKQKMRENGQTVEDHITSVHFPERGHTEEVKKPVIEDWPSEAMNGINGFLDAVKHHKIKFLKVEQVVYDPKLDIVGKYDALAEVDGQATLIDYKSSAGIYPTMLAQVAKYQRMFTRESAVDQISNCSTNKLPITESVFDGPATAIFHFGKQDGSFRFIPLSNDQLEAGLTMFNGLYDAYMANKQLSKFLKEGR